MKVRILKKLPNGFQVKNLETGEIIKYPKQFFKSRCNLGLIEVENLKAIQRV